MYGRDFRSIIQTFEAIIRRTREKDARYAGGIRQVTRAVSQELVEEVVDALAVRFTPLPMSEVARSISTYKLESPRGGEWANRHTLIN